VAPCKNVSTRGRLGRSAAFIFLFWDPLHISKTSRARKLKFGVLVGNRQTNERNERYKTLCLCLPVLPGGGIKITKYEHTNGHKTITPNALTRSESSIRSKTSSSKCSYNIYVQLVFLCIFVFCVGRCGFDCQYNVQSFRQIPTQKTNTGIHFVSHLVSFSR